MSNESKKDLIIGMLYGLLSTFEGERTEHQKNCIKEISTIINEIYYPKKDLNIPTTRAFDNE